MMNVKPGDVICFRVGQNNKQIETEYYFITAGCGGIVESKFGVTSPDQCRYELELIDPARVTIADEKVEKPKWGIWDNGYWIYVRNINTGALGVAWNCHLFPNAKELAQAECDRLNERDTPKPRWVVRKSDREPSWYEVLDAQGGVREFGGYQFYSLSLARDMCDVMERHYGRTTGD